MSEDKKIPMIIRSVSMSLELWERAKVKAGLTPLSAIIRVLLEGWLEGEFKIRQ